MFDILIIGERIRSLRQSAGMTLEDLASACDVSRTTIFNIEKGVHKDVSSSLMMCIAEKLGVSVDDLLGAAKPPTPIPGFDDLQPDEQEAVRLLVQRLAGKSELA